MCDSKNMSRRAVCLALAAAILSVAALHAHSIHILGTVLAVEPARVEVKTIDDQTKKEQEIWCAVDQNTKVKRGDTLVKFADAKIVKGERVAVTIDHDAKVKNLATEIQLAAPTGK